MRIRKLTQRLWGSFALSLLLFSLLTALFLPGTTVEKAVVNR